VQEVERTQQTLCERARVPFSAILQAWPQQQQQQQQQQQVHPHHQQQRQQQDSDQHEQQLRQLQHPGQVRLLAPCQQNQQQQVVVCMSI